jgi:ribosomal protein L11 methyltransferase
VGTDRLRWPGAWRRLSLNLPRSSEDDVIGLIQLLGGQGAACRPAGPGRIVLDAWFAREDEALRAAERLRAAPGVRVAAGGPELVVDTGWLAAGTPRRGPLRIGRFVVLDEAGARRAAVRGRIPLVIPPGRAFGTGEHATTRMCLALLGDLLHPGDDVLDFGAGAAILAIAAAKAGARSVVALDSDPNVIDVARENVELNGVAESVAVRTGSWGDLAEDARFGLMLANVHRTALVRGARALAARLEPGGRAILSGFSPADAGLVLAAWRRAGVAKISQVRDGEWAALAVHTPGRR